MENTGKGTGKERGKAVDAAMQIDKTGVKRIPVEEATPSDEPIIKSK